MVALDTLMGTDESIGFEDFLNGMIATVTKLISTMKLCSFTIPLSVVFCKAKVQSEDKKS